MAEPKTRLWNSFDGKGFAAEYAEYSERASKDVEGNEISKTYATKDAATTSAPGLMSAADKEKLDGIAAGAQANTIETISANGTALEISNKNVDIPLATDEVDGLLPHGKFPLIPPAPDGTDGPDQVYSFDGTNGMSWQTIVKDYLGNMVLDQQGNPVTGEDGSPVFSEDSIRLWLSYKGTEFGARRAYDDHTGANIHDSIEARTTMAQVTAAIETALANYGGFRVVDTLVDGHPDVQDPSERFIYLYKDPRGPEADPYTEWIYTVDNEWDVIGTTYVDLSPYYTSAQVDLLLDTKVDTVSGKGLSTNDYTNEEKTKLGGIETGAQVNIIETVKLAGTAIIPDADKAVDIVLDYASDADIEAMFDDNVVEIDGRTYKTVKIGNQVWLAENLDFRFSINGNQLALNQEGNPSTAAAWYYNNDDGSTYGISGTYRCGLLYNWYAVKALNDNRSTLIPGWHVPSKTDYQTLIDFVGTTPGTKLKAINNSVAENWPPNNTGWDGTDEYGFSALPSGERTSSGFKDLGKLGELWTTTENPNNAYYAYVMGIGYTTDAGINEENKTEAYAIRLVKDTN